MLGQQKKSQKKNSRSKIDSLTFLVGQDNTPKRVQITTHTIKSMQNSSKKLVSVNRRMTTKRKYKTRVRKTIK